MKSMQQELMSCWHNTSAGVRHKFARACLPKRSIPPDGNYEAVQTLAARMWLIDYLGHVDPKSDADNVHLMVWFATLRKYGMPSYYIDREFAQAAALTEPPADVRVGDLKLPMPAFTLYPDKRFARTMFGAAVRFITVLSVDPGNTELELLSGYPATTVESPELPAVRIIYSRDYDQHGVSIPVEGSHTLLKSDRLSECTRVDEDAEVLSNSLSSVKRLVNEADSALDEAQAQTEAKRAAAVSKKVCNFTMQLLMVLNTRADYFVTEGECVRMGKQKQAKAVDALWSANIIGKGYRAPCRPPTGPGDGAESDVKVRTHWRRGHLHTVLFGPARSKSRLDWFEPVLVNAPEKEQT